MGTDEVKTLIALAKQAPGDDDKVIELSEFEEFVVEVNLLPGEDTIPFMLISDYFEQWSGQSKCSYHKPLLAFIRERLTVITTSTNTTLLIDEKQLKVSRDDMKRKIGIRLNERRKEKRKIKEQKKQAKRRSD